MSKVIDCVVLVDDDFMNKDVSELNIEDYYLFHTNGNKLWLYKNSVIVAAGIDAHGDEYAFRVPTHQGNFTTVCRRFDKSVTVVLLYE